MTTDKGFDGAGLSDGKKSRVTVKRSVPQTQTILFVNLLFLYTYFLFSFFILSILLPWNKTSWSITVVTLFLFYFYRNSK